MRKDDYRGDVDGLIADQNRDLPVCPFDGRPCSSPERGCEQSAFGVLTSDGKDKVVSSCPRFKPDSVSRFR